PLPSGGFSARYSSATGNQGRSSGFLENSSENAWKISTPTTLKNTTAPNHNATDRACIVRVKQSMISPFFSPNNGGSAPPSLRPRSQPPTVAVMLPQPTPPPRQTERRHPHLLPAERPVR